MTAQTYKAGTTVIVSTDKGRQLALVIGTGRPIGSEKITDVLVRTNDDVQEWVELERIELPVTEMTLDFDGPAPRQFKHLADTIMAEMPHRFVWAGPHESFPLCGLCWQSWIHDVHPMEHEFVHLDPDPWCQVCGCSRHANLHVYRDVPDGEDPLAEIERARLNARHHAYATAAVRAFAVLGWDRSTDTTGGPHPSLWTTTEAFVERLVVELKALGKKPEYDL